MEQVDTAVPNTMRSLSGCRIPLLSRASNFLRNSVLAVISLGLILLTSLKWKEDNAEAFNLSFSLSVIVTTPGQLSRLPYDLSLLMLPVALVGNTSFRKRHNS